VSLAKTLSVLELRARARRPKENSARVAAVRDRVQRLLMTPERWEREKARFAALTHREQVAEVDERLREARRLLAAGSSPGCKSNQTVGHDAGLSWFFARNLEIELAALQGASPERTRWMSERACRLVRTESWQATMHLSAIEDLETCAKKSSVMPWQESARSGQVGRRLSELLNRMTRAPAEWPQLPEDPATPWFEPRE
jgi:hypothetical protein